MTFTAACGGTGTADDDAVWTVTSDGTESNYDGTKGIHYGTSSAAVGYIQLSTSDIAGTITSVVVNASAASGVSASVSVTVGADAFTCESETTAAVSASATDYTFEGSASGKIVVRLAKAASAKKALYVKSVVVTYEEAEASTTKTYYLTLSSDWAGWPAKYAIYYFKSSDNTQNGWSEFMTAVPEEDNTYIGTIPAGYDKLIFARFNSEATAPAWDSNKWSQTVDLTAPTNDNDWFTVTSGGTGSECNGIWSKHGEPVIPAKFYITGDSALVTDAGFAGKAWNPDAIKSETDTFTMNLKAGVDYQLKITTDGTWGTVKGYNKLTKVAAGLKDLDGDNHNIGFKLNEAGEVKVVYTDKVFELLGDFFVETPAKYYITGDSALVTDAGAPGASWNPAAIKSETDTFTLKNLKAGQEYILKLTLNGTWVGENNVKGYNELTEKTPGLKDISDDHNIGFKLNEAGDVQVIYKDSETPIFKLVGNFFVEIPHYFIAGTMTNWKDEMVELLPLEEKADSLGVSLNLKADSLYLYKIVRVQGTDTAWYGLDGDATMEYGNSTGWYIYKSEGDKNQKNVGLQTTKEAVYPFVLKVKEDHLEVSVTIPARYYAKYAPNWEWAQLIEKEGKWLTDTIVYAGIGVNINVKASDEGNMFFSNTVEEEGVRPIAGDEIAELDTVQFSFNPVDTTLTVSLISKYVAPAIHYYVAGTMTNWKDEMVELLPLVEKADSLGVSLNLKADSLYAYKIVRVLGPDTAWYGLDGEATMEYGNSTGWYIYKSEGEKNQKNVGLQTTKEGDYPVTLVIKEDQLIVSVVIPKPDTKYYAKYADKAGEWNWKLLTEKEGKWLTDTIVYYGGGMNIHSAEEGDGKYFAEIAGVAAKDTAYFSFNPEDSTLVATVVGKYVVPIAEDGYYLLGTFNDWTPSAAYMFVANEQKPGEFVLTATLAVDDEFKVVKCEGVNWTWYPAEGDNFVVMACYAGEKTMYFSPEVNTDWHLLGGHLYMDYTFKPGYYLVGSMTSWLPKSQYWIAEYVDDPPYVLETTLQVGWNIKVAKLEGTGEVSQYYPDGEGNHYTVDEEHSGDVYFYFNPVYNGEWQNYWAAKGYNYGWWLMIEKKSTVDIEITNDGVQAIKVLRDGQILIIKGEKTYNALGILVE